MSCAPGFVRDLLALHKAGNVLVPMATGLLGCCKRVLSPWLPKDTLVSAKVTHSTQLVLLGPSVRFVCGFRKPTMTPPLDNLECGEGPTWEMGLPWFTHLKLFVCWDGVSFASGKARAMLGCPFIFYPLRSCPVFVWGKRPASRL